MFQRTTGKFFAAADSSVPFALDFPLFHHYEIFPHDASKLFFNYITIEFSVSFLPFSTLIKLSQKLMNIHDFTNNFMTWKDFSFLFSSVTSCLAFNVEIALVLSSLTFTCSLFVAWIIRDKFQLIIKLPAFFLPSVRSHPFCSIYLCVLCKCRIFDCNLGFSFLFFTFPR